MVIKNIEFFKNIVSEKTLNQYEQLKDCENYLNVENIHKDNFKIEGSEIILYIALRDILLAIKGDKKQLNKQKLIIGFNTFIYNIKKLFKITEKDKQLELTIKKIILEKRDALLYLNMLNKILIQFYTNSTITDLSTIYLYYSTLMDLHQIVDNYLKKLFTINENNSKHISVTFNDETNIEQTLIDIESIKSLVMTYKNNQEKS